MADLAQLEAALIKADAAGDTEGAGVLAGEVRRMRSAPAASIPEMSAGIPEGMMEVGSRRPQFVSDSETGRASMIYGPKGTKLVPQEGPLSRGIYEAGGLVTDAAARAGVSPEVAGGLGVAANLGLQIPALLLGGPAKSAAPLMETGAKHLMQSAVKPTLAQLRSGDAATAIDTLLKEGISPTEAGVATLKDKIGVLNDQVKEAIANSPAMVRKSAVGQRLMDTWDRVIKQVNPEADLNAVKNAWMEFRNHPLLAGKIELPVQLAQEMKQGTYRQLSKKYGEMGSADVEAQKALARGLKEEISAAVPEVAGLNAQESRLITTLNVAERRALMELNKNPAGLTLLAHHPGAAAAFLADRSAAFKSIVARMMYAGKERIPQTAGQVTGATIASQLGQPPD